MIIKNKKIKFILLFLLAIVIFGFLFKFFYQKEGQTKTLRIAYIPVTDCLQVIAAKENGFFAKSGLNVQLVSIPNGAKAIEALASGSVDIAFANLASVIAARINNVPIKIVSGGALDTKEHKIHALLVRKDSPIKSPNDLIGKRIALPIRRSIDYAYLADYLAKNNVPIEDINFTEIPFPQMDGVLKAGTVDAIATAEPYATISLLQGETRVLSYYFAEVTPRAVVAGYVANENWIKNNRDIVERFNQSIASSTDYLNKNEEESRKMILSFINIDREAALKMNLTEFTNSFSEDEIKDLISKLRKYNIISGEIDPRDLLTY